VDDATHRDEQVAGAQPSGSRLWPVGIVPAAPTGQQAERVEETTLKGGRLETTPEGLLRISARFYRTSWIVGLSALLTALTMVCLVLWLPERWGLAIPGGFAWFVLFTLLCQKDRTFTVDPRRTRMRYLAWDQVICIELPSGKWLGIKPQTNGADELWRALRPLYETQDHED